jgi:hypothetical protein
MMFIRVVFPEPEGPIIEIVSASFTSRESLSRTIPLLENDFDISFIDSILYLKFQNSRFRIPASAGSDL